MIDSLVLPKTAGKGILVDLAAPTYGWRDMLGPATIRGVGPNDPTLTVYRGNLREFAFANNAVNALYFQFHIPHDYVPGSDLYLHVHWSQIAADTGGAGGTPGDVKWSVDVSYSKGHSQEVFNNPFTTSIIQTSSGIPYMHMLPEIQLSSSTPTAIQLDSSNIEVDGLLLMRLFRDPADPQDTLNQLPFLHFMDIHYQSTNLATKQKAPDFYV